MAEKGRVLTGARARFLLGGKKVGYAQGVQVNEELEFQPIEALDNIEVEENVPIGYRVSMSAQLVRLVGASIKAAGYFPPVGKTPQEHLTNILQQGVLTAVIEDNKKNKRVAMVEEVKVSTNNTSISARGVVGVDVNMVAIRMRDEFDAI